MNTQIKKMN